MKKFLLGVVVAIAFVIALDEYYWYTNKSVTFTWHGKDEDMVRAA